MAAAKFTGPLFLLALLVIWEIVAQTEWINALIIPPPSRMSKIFSELVVSGQIPWQILASMKRAAAGYFLAAAVLRLSRWRPKLSTALSRRCRWTTFARSRGRCWRMPAAP